MKQFLVLLSAAVLWAGQRPSFHGVLSTPPAVSDTSFVISSSPGSARNNFDGDVGFQFTVGTSSITVTMLGRMMLTGNTGTHTVKITKDSDKSTVASVSISMSGGPVGSYKYVSLGSPVVLSASTIYYLTSSETSGGDNWADLGSFTHTTAATVGGAQYYNGSWNVTGSTDQEFNQLSLQYH